MLKKVVLVSSMLGGLLIGIPVAWSILIGVLFFGHGMVVVLFFVACLLVGPVLAEQGIGRLKNARWPLIMATAAVASSLIAMTALGLDATVRPYFLGEFCDYVPGNGGDYRISDYSSCDINFGRIAAYGLIFLGTGVVVFMAALAGGVLGYRVRRRSGTPGP